MLKRITALAGAALCLAAVFPVTGLGTEDFRGPLGEDDILALVSQAPAESDRPDAEALVVFDGTYISHEEGMATVRRQRLVKIYTEYAIEELGDPRIAYDGSRQELRIHASRTYLPDGTTMDTPENGYNEVTPFGLDRASGHLGIREMVVSHVGIVRGASILLDWTVKDTRPTGLPFNRLYLMADEFPTLEKEVVAEGDLYGETVNPSRTAFALAAPVGRQGRLIWRAGDLPERPRRADGRLGDQIPWIAISAVPTWEDLLGDLGGRVAKAASSTHHIESVLDYMEEETPFLGERETLERVTEAVGERTYLVDYRPWRFGCLPATANASILTSTATPLERCVLIMSACRSLDLDADLILPGRWQEITEDVPALEAMASPLVRVAGSEGTWYVDPVGGAVTAWQPVRAGMPYFTVGGGMSKAGLPEVVRERAPVGANTVRLAVFWDLETGEAKADGYLEGPIVRGLAWEEPGQMLEEWAAGWSDSAETGDVRVLTSGPEAIAYAAGIDAPLPPVDDRGRVILELPMPPCDMEDLLPPALDPVLSEIDGWLFPPAPAAVRLTWKIGMPEGYRLLPGEDREIVLEGGSLRLERTVTAGLIEVAYRFTWDGRAVSPEAYAAHRRLILEATDQGLLSLVFAEEETDE